MKPIPYGRQHITDEDIQSVKEALQSDFLTQGPRVEEFEEAFAAYVGARYAVAVANGTAALHLSAMALGLKPGEKVITTPITFVASANCVRYLGAEVHFVDIDKDTYLLDLNKTEDVLKSHPKGTFKGVIPVDFAGYPVNLEDLKTLAAKYDIWILEDACHAPGGYFTNTKGLPQYCGNGTYADLAIFSFHPVKHIATGEGGMVTTQNKDLYEHIMQLRTHGITRNPDLLHENHGGWYYEMQELGYNYRLPDILAALGISQLKRADEGLNKRQAIAKRYQDAFAGHNVITPKLEAGYYHAYHLYVIQVENRKGLYDFLRKEGIYAQVHYIPVHLQPYYRQLGWHDGVLPVAEHYYKNCLSLPMFPSLTDAEQTSVIDKVIEFVK